MLRTIPDGDRMKYNSTLERRPGFKDVGRCIPDWYYYPIENCKSSLSQSEQAKQEYLIWH